MEEKEVKKLNEESVEKISGGTKVDGPEKVEKDLGGCKNNKNSFSDSCIWSYKTI